MQHDQPKLATRAERRTLKIGVDIDGVLADIVEQIRPLLSRLCGRPVCHADITCYHFGEALNIPRGQVEILMDEVVDAGHFAAAPPLEGAIAGLTALAHHSLWLVTARPEQARDQTTLWLSRHQIPYQRLVFAPAVAKARCGDGFDLFIEDHLEGALGLSREGIPVLLFDWPWNRCCDLPENVRRVHNWGEIVRVVAEMACA